MSFSEFSLTAGVTANPSAVLEQCAALTCLIMNRQIALNDLDTAIGETMVVRHFHYDENEMPPASMILQASTGLYIYVGGTNMIVNGNISNCGGAMTPCSFGGGNLTNLFWFGCADRVAQRIIPALPAGWQAMRLHFVGHSQGAAIGLLLAMSLRNVAGTIPYDWLGFASPKAISGPAVAGQLLPRFGFNVSTVRDAVPMCPPNRAYSVLAAVAMNPLLWGAINTWTHLTPTAVIKPDGAINYVEPASDYFTLRIGDLANLANTHPWPIYQQVVSAWWEANNA